MQTRYAVSVNWTDALFAINILQNLYLNWNLCEFARTCNAISLQCNGIKKYLANSANKNWINGMNGLTNATSLLSQRKRDVNQYNYVHWRVTIFR